MPNPLIERYSKPVPRYTSYPTAPHFHAGIDNGTYGHWLQALPAGAAISLYIHIPYCDRLCWFCGCHTKQVKRYDPISTYLHALAAEIAAVGKRLDGRGRVVSLHLGGGSPSMLSPEDMRALNAQLRSAFAFSPQAEISIEIDPNDMDGPRYDALAEIGVTRVSVGAQDFNPKVQAAINRLQTFEQTKAVVDGMRERGVRSANIDVLYGLPFQTVATVQETIRQVLDLSPDRISLFGYAHVPWMKTHQRMIDESALPDIHGRFEQASSAAEQIVAAGYEAIGFDHFARPLDSLAIAARTGRLHRNFQGYTTDAQDALIGLGASAIGQLPQGYVQNTVPTADYQRQVLDGGTAIARGVALTPDDRIRGYLIERLMCDFAVTTDDLERKFGTDAEVVITELRERAEGHLRDLVVMEDGVFQVRHEGRPLVRSVAAAFDSYLNVGAARYSVAV